MAQDRWFNAAWSQLNDALSGGIHWTRVSAAAWDRYKGSGELSVLDEAIAAYRRLVAVTPPTHPDRGCRLSNLGDALKVRFDRVDELWCLEAAVNIYRQAANATPQGHAHRRKHLSVLVTTLRQRLEVTGDPAVLDDIVTARQELAEAWADHPDRACRLCELGDVLRERFQRSGELSSLTAAAQAYRSATEPPLHRHAHRVEHLSRRATVLADLIERVAEPQLRDEMIDVRRQLVDGTARSVPKYRDRLVDLGGALWIRYRQDAQPALLEELLAVFQRAEATTPPDHPERGCQLSNVAAALGMQLGESADPALLAEVIKLHRQSVEATPVGNPHQLRHLVRLGTALHRLYRQSADAAVLDEVIEVFRLLVATTSPDDPDRLGYLVDLSQVLLDRYQQTGDSATLEETVTVHQDLTAVLPRDDPDRPRHLSNLGAVLLNRFQQSKDPALLDPIIDVCRRAMTVMPAVNPQRPKVLANLAAALVEQAARADPAEQQARWPEAVTMLRRAADALSTDDPDWPLVHCNLGTVLQQKFEQLKDPADLREAVDVFRNAVETTPLDNPHWLTCLAKLADASLARAEQPGSPAELLDEAITTQRRLLDATPVDKPERANHAARLAGALQFRHRRLGDLDALEEAVSIHRALAAEIPPGHPGRRCALHNLGTALRVRDVAADHPAGVAEETLEILREAAGFPSARSADQADLLDPGHQARHLSDLVEGLGIRAKCTAELRVIDEMITALRMLTSGPDDQPLHLLNLGNALLFRHGHSGGVELLDDAIGILRQALAAIPAASAQRPAGQALLGEALYRRYHGSHEVALLDEAIEMLRMALDGTSTDDPARCRWLSLLGLALQYRYDLSGDRVLLERAGTALRQAATLPSTGTLERCRLLDDLGDVLLRLARHTDEPAIFCEAVQAYRQAVEATPADHQERAHHLCGLGGALVAWSERSGDPSLLEEAITVLRAASAAAPAGHPNQVTCLTNLSSALRASYKASGRQVLLDEAIDILQQAVELSCEPTVVALALANLSSGLLSQYYDNADAAALDDAVRYALQALEELPDDHPDRGVRLSILGDALVLQYQETGKPARLDDAVRCYRQARTVTPADHAHLAGIHNRLGVALLWHYNRTGELSVLDQAIGLLRQAVEATPAGHPDRPQLLTHLGLVLDSRYDRTGDKANLTEAVEWQRAAAAAVPPHASDRLICLTNLGNALKSLFYLTGDPELLEKSIQAHRDACSACPAGHPMRPCLHANLSAALRAAHRQNGKRAVLDEAVAMQRHAVAGTPADHPHRPVHLAELSAILRVRHDHTGDDRDLIEATDRSRQAVAAAPAAPPREQIDVYARWGRLAARTGEWGAALDALATAVELLPRVVPAELHRDDQEHRLTGFAGIASDAAACALQVGDPWRAVELLEQGRGMLLKQAVARGEEIELRERSPALADRLDRLRAELHGGATRIRADHAPGQDPAALTPAADQLSELTAELEQLLEGIRAMPGFERFHLPPVIGDLLADLPDGPVVLINVSRFRSDALVLDTGDVRVIPLPALDPDSVHDRAAGFLAALEGSRDHEQPDTERKRARQGMCGTLCWLWDTVAAPVLDALELTAPADPRAALPRLWWSPTGLLSLLPLHAAGHHHDRPDDPAGPHPRTVIDRVVSSYTPTVALLQRARQRLLALPAGTPRVLMVSMPNAPGADTLAQTWKEAFTSAGQPDVRILSDVGATREQVLAALPAYSWVHFACHSYTDLIRPSTSCLVLHDHADQPLSAQDISGLRLRGVQLAFLSACDTARNSVDLADEAIHLASSFQIAGYPHVVGTLWAVVDAKATQVAEKFYGRLANGTVADRNHIATALHHATRELHKSWPNSPWLWGAHIHMGP